MNSPVEEVIGNFNIDRKSKDLIYIQVVNALIHSIQVGEIKHDQKLPGARKIAEILKVNRNTVIKSLEELQILGFVKIIPNKGTFIIKPIQEKITAFTISNFNKKSSFDFNQSILLDTPTKSDNYKIEINEGKLDERENEFKFPSKRYSTLLQSHLKNKNNTAFFYKQFTNYINVTRNLDIKLSNLLITRTPEMAIQIISKVLLNDESLIAIENLSDYKANIIFQSNNSKLISIKSDENGICTKDLKNICFNNKINALFINSNHSYPTTVALSSQKKNELIELSNHFGFVIIENDADFDFYNTLRPNFPMSTNNSLKNVIYTSQFGNELSPGFRFSYIIAPTDFINEAKRHLTFYESPMDPLVLQTIAEMIYEGDIGRILKKKRKFYKERREYYYKLLIENFENKISVTLPKNGLAFWIEINNKINLMELKNQLDKNGIYISHFNLYQTDKICGIRFGFANLNEKEMISIIDLLKTIIN